jgi:hypothetical protein
MARRKIPPKVDPLALLWLAVKWETVYQIALKLYPAHPVTREEHLTANRYNRSFGYEPDKKIEARQSLH